MKVLGTESAFIIVNTVSNSSHGRRIKNIIHKSFQVTCKRGVNNSTFTDLFQISYYNDEFEEDSAENDDLRI